MAYATAEDVAVRWARELTCEEAALVEVRLEDVERMIRRQIPDLDQQVRSGIIDIEDVVQVESDAVLRLARNPDGYLSETDGNYMYQLRSDLATGKLELTEDEWLILGVRRSRMFYLTPYPVVDGQIDNPASTRRRRTVESAWRENKVIDWTRQIW